MTTDERAELLAALTAERYNGGGWRPTNAPMKAPQPDDSEMTTARRRRVLLDEYAASSLHRDEASA